MAEEYHYVEMRSFKLMQQSNRGFDLSGPLLAQSSKKSPKVELQLWCHVQTWCNCKFSLDKCVHCEIESFHRQEEKWAPEDVSL